MFRSIAFLLFSTLLAAPALATSFQIYEASAGSPGVTAQFPIGTSLFADIDFDADSAEGGALLFGPSEITIVPLGDLVFVDFVCELAVCGEGSEYVFTPGGAGVGQVVVSDPNSDSPLNGVFDLGTIEFDINSAFGQIQLSSCNYTDANAIERQCSPFTLVTVPEPGTGALVALGLVAVTAVRRRR